MTDLKKVLIEREKEIQMNLHAQQLQLNECIVTREVPERPLIKLQNVNESVKQTIPVDVSIEFDKAKF